MSLTDRYRNPNPKTASSNTFECQHYCPLSGSKRCRHYLKAGACSRSDEFMCLEWLKANGHSVPAALPNTAKQASQTEHPTPKVNTERFGYPLPEETKTQRTDPKRQTAIPAPDLQPFLSKIESEVEEPIRGFTAEDIDGFKKNGFEFHVQSETLGEFWLVPEYTGQDRKEITPEHAATVFRVLQVFPGARVESFRKSPKPMIVDHFILS